MIKYAVLVVLLNTGMSGWEANAEAEFVSKYFMTYEAGECMERAAYINQSQPMQVGNYTAACMPVINPPLKAKNIERY